MKKSPISAHLSGQLKATIKPIDIGTKSLDFSVQADRIVVQIGIAGMPSRDIEGHFRTIFDDIYRRINEVIKAKMQSQTGKGALISRDQLHIYVSDDYGMGRTLLGIIFHDRIEWESSAANISFHPDPRAGQ